MQPKCYTESRNIRKSYILIIIIVISFTLSSCNKGLLDSSNEIEIIAPDFEGYSGIIDAYKAFVLDREKNMEKAINALATNIILETNLADEGTQYEIWCSSVDARDKNVGYAIHDINSDDIPELIIISDDYFVHAIYSLSNKQPICLGGYWYRNRCGIDNDGIIYTRASGGAAYTDFEWHSIVLNEPKLQLVRTIGTEPPSDTKGDKPNSLKYFTIINGEKVFIEQKEFETILHNFPDIDSGEPTKSIGLNYIPFTQAYSETEV